MLAPIVRFLHSTGSTTEDVNDMDKLALVEATVYVVPVLFLVHAHTHTHTHTHTRYTIEHISDISRSCSTVMLQESVIPYLTWLLCSPEKSLSDAVLSALCTLNSRNSESSFLVMCHDGVPTLVDMICQDKNAQAKELYTSCRRNHLSAALSLLRLRDTRSYMKAILSCACVYLMLPFGEASQDERMINMLREYFCTFSLSLFVKPYTHIFYKLCTQVHLWEY